MCSLHSPRPSVSSRGRSLSHFLPLPLARELPPKGSPQVRSFLLRPGARTFPSWGLPLAATTVESNRFLLVVTAAAAHSKAQTRRCISSREKDEERPSAQQSTKLALIRLHSRDRLRFRARIQQEFPAIVLPLFSSPSCSIVLFRLQRRIALLFLSLAVLRGYKLLSRWQIFNEKTVSKDCITIVEIIRHFVGIIVYIMHRYFQQHLHRKSSQ